jgi:hypothetical protein
MSFSKLLTVSVLSLAACANAQDLHPAGNADKKECVFIYQAPLGADTSIGDVSMAKNYLVIDTNSNVFDHNFDLKTCRDNKNWHCIEGGGYALYIPKPYSGSVQAWKNGSKNYKFLASASITIASHEIKYRPLVVYKGSGKNIDILETYLFDEAMNLIGIIDYDQFDHKTQEKPEIIPFNYWLVGKSAPLSCY